MIAVLERALALLLSLLPAPADAEALRVTAPQYLTAETAPTHLALARAASVAAGVDPDLVLSIAWFESRYRARTVTAEPRGKTSCGVMTPIPRRRCVAPSLAAGYLEGALHLRQWLDACRGSIVCALRGYAGGYALIRACRAGPYFADRGGRSVNICVRAAGERLRRATWIKRMRERARVRGDL